MPAEEEREKERELESGLIILICLPISLRNSGGVETRGTYLASLLINVRLLGIIGGLRGTLFEWPVAEA